MKNSWVAFVNERDAPAAADQPRVEISSWRLVQAANGDRRLLAILEGGSLRVTSRIVNFDPVSVELITESNRRYRLMRPPEDRQVQHDLLRANASRVGLGDAADISSDLWSLVEGMSPDPKSV